MLFTTIICVSCSILETPRKISLGFGSKNQIFVPATGYGDPSYCEVNRAFTNVIRTDDFKATLLLESGTKCIAKPHEGCEPIKTLFKGFFRKKDAPSSNQALSMAAMDLKNPGVLDKELNQSDICDLTYVDNLTLTTPAFRCNFDKATKITHYIGISEEDVETGNVSLDNFVRDRWMDSNHGFYKQGVFDGIFGDEIFRNNISLAKGFSETCILTRNFSGVFVKTNMPSVISHLDKNQEIVKIDGDSCTYGYFSFQGTILPKRLTQEYTSTLFASTKLQRRFADSERVSLRKRNLSPEKETYEDIIIQRKKRRKDNNLTQSWDLSSSASTSAMPPTNAPSRNIFPSITPQNIFTSGYQQSVYDLWNTIYKNQLFYLNMRALEESRLAYMLQGPMASINQMHSQTPRRSTLEPSSSASVFGTLSSNEPINMPVVPEVQPSTSDHDLTEATDLVHSETPWKFSDISDDEDDTENAEGKTLKTQDQSNIPGTPNSSRERSVSLGENSMGELVINE